jgi:hypothetical protein
MREISWRQLRVPVNQALSCSPHITSLQCQISYRAALQVQCSEETRAVLRRISKCVMNMKKEVLLSFTKFHYLSDM